MTIRDHTLRLLELGVLAFCCLPVAGLLGQDHLVGHEDIFYSFSESFEIEKDWKEFLGEEEPLALVQTLLQKDATGKHVVPRGEAPVTSTWVATNRWLKKNPKVLSALRLAQNTEAPTALYLAKRSGDPDRLLTTYRTFPWADPVHRASIETGERLLRGGRPTLALRYFQDVLLRSEDAALQAHAQAGLWLAAAHLTDSPDTINAMFQDVDPDSLYPWFGKQVKALDIQTKLTAGMKNPEPAPKLSTLKMGKIQLPDDPPFMGNKGRMGQRGKSKYYPHKVQPVITSEGTLVAGACLLAWYDGESLDIPTWTQVASTNVGSVPPTPLLTPAVAGGRFYTRHINDLAPPGVHVRLRKGFFNHTNGIFAMREVGAFDCRTGKVIWTTLDAPAWKEVFPLNDPICRDGRLYLLTMSITGTRANGQTRYLMILDAHTGHILQKRELVTCHSDLRFKTPAPGQPNQRLEEKELSLSSGARNYGHDGANVSRYVNRVAVRDGEVYCSTSLGVAARYDVRDGMIEWAAKYPRVLVGWRDSTALALRQGSAPMVGDKQVVFSPHDTAAVFALDRGTGDMVWMKTNIEKEAAVQEPADGGNVDASLQTLGLLGDSVLVIYGRRIAALDLATGKQRWQRMLDQPIERPVKIFSDAFYLVTCAEIHRIDNESGEILETRPLAPIGAACGSAFGENSLQLVEPGKYGITCPGVPGKEAK